MEDQPKEQERPPSPITPEMLQQQKQKLRKTPEQEQPEQEQLEQQQPEQEQPEQEQPEQEQPEQEQERPEQEQPEQEKEKEPEQAQPTPQPQRRANPPPQRRAQSVSQDRQQQLMNQYSAPQQEMGEEKPKKRRGLMVAAFLAPGLTKRYLQAKMMLAQYEQIKMQREAMAGNRGNYKLARQIDNVDLRRTLQQKQQQMGMIQGQRQQHQGHQMQQLGMEPQKQQIASQQQQQTPKPKRDLGAFKKAQQDKQKGMKDRGDM